MLDMQKIQETVPVKFGDETYQIKYISDERIREISKQKNINLNSVLTPEADKDVPVSENIISSIMDAVFNSEFIIAVACESCTGWTGIMSGGKPFPCNEKNKRAVFEAFGNRAMFIYKNSRSERTFMNGGTLEEDLKN